MTSYSAVPHIQLNRNGSITLEVELYGFETGTPVEIFGQASQTNGAVAPFHKVKLMPDHKDEESASVTLDQIPAIKLDKSKPFDETRPITVVARAAVAWITILKFKSPEDFGSEAIPLMGSGEFQARFEGGEDDVYPAVSPDA